MKEVYGIWCENDDMDGFLVGIATSEEKASDMINVLKKEFKDTFNYPVVKEKLDVLCINDKEIIFEKGEDNMNNKLSELYEMVKLVLAEAPNENDYTDEENEVYADCQNLKESLECLM